MPTAPPAGFPALGAPVAGEEAVRHLTVAADDAPQRIDNFLMRELKGLPRSRIYRMLRKGEVRVNGGRVKPTHRLEPGDTIRIPPVRRAGADPAAGPLPVGQGVLDALERAILFEDEDLLVLDKPSGLAVHGGSGIGYGVIEALRRLRPEGTLELAHRLDRDTSGCLLVAKRRRTLAALHQALRDRSVGKVYTVVVHGAWPRRIRTVQLPLARYLTAEGERRVRVAADGKPSRTDIEIQASAPGASLLTARLHTGRTHQIRVHAAASGHPVVGDEKYSTPAQLAGAREAGVHRLCLHAASISLVLDGRRRRFEAPLPAALTAAFEALGGG